MNGERNCKQSRADIPDAILVECDVESLPAMTRRRQTGSRIAALAMAAISPISALVEQYERLAQINQSWHEERSRAAGELDSLAERLVAEEQDLVDRQKQTEAGEESLRRRMTEIESVRQEIAIYRAQLQSREELIEVEHAEQMEALRRKETLIEEQLVSLTQLRNRWNHRRQEEIGQLQSSRASLTREQSETTAPCAELFAKSRRLAGYERSLAEKSLAVEQFWQEISVRAKDPEAQGRVDGLRRTWLTVNAALVDDAKNERAAVTKELERLEQLRVHLQEQATRLTNHGAAMAEKYSLLDEREVILKNRQNLLDDEFCKLEHLKSEPERQRILLRADADAVAEVVFAENPSSPVDKAA